MAVLSFGGGQAVHVVCGRLWSRVQSQEAAAAVGYVNRWVPLFVSLGFLMKMRGPWLVKVVVHTGAVGQLGSVDIKPYYQGKRVGSIDKDSRLPQANVAASGNVNPC